MKSSILKPIVETAIRHGANALGTWLVGTGLITDAQSQTLIGAVIILGSLAWSLANGLKK